uniref:Phosphodiesterase n=1 Tax=Hanusia phi TaxID=3032 RepID=A0A7S0DUT1_9CRYP|mmetsp:Transcript_10045/g.22903  ORF Transcript_10045/g.22903 Transcript_10045/m.22903 type:complete len:658 (+) Transcript_10045:190-2163(+)
MELLQVALRKLRLGFLRNLFIKWFGLVSYSGNENGKELESSQEGENADADADAGRMLKESLSIQELRAENEKLKLKVDKLARIVTMRRMSENDSQTVNQDQLLALARNAMAREREDATLHKLVDTIVQSAYHLLMAQRISVFVQDDVNQELWLAASDDAVGLRIPSGKGVAGMVARTMQPINIPDCQESSLFDPGADQMTGFVTKTMICVPITWNGYYLIGVFQALNKQDNEGNIIPFTEYDLDMLNILSKELAGALRRKAVEFTFDRVLGRAASSLSEEDRRQASFLQSFYQSPSRVELRRGSSTETEKVKESITRNRRRSTVFCVPEGFQLSETGALASELSWDFDVWQKSEDQLVVYAMDIYKSSGLCDHFRISDDVLLHFILAVKRQYNHCPFHNFRHAFAVMQTLYVVLRDTSVTDHLTDIDKLALVTAALCHDIDHPGVTNDLLVKTGSDLALLYNDCSVLENHHCTTTFKILRHPQNNIFATLDKEDFVQVRKAMITAILGTDMKRHVELCGKMRMIVDGKSADGQLPLDAENEDDRMKLMEIVLHACDLSAQAQNYHLSEAWGNRVLQEFQEQAASEEAAGVSVTPFMQGLDVPVNRAKTQQNFVGYVVMPLWESFAEMFPPMEVAYKHSKLNFDRYKMEVQRLQENEA